MNPTSEALDEFVRTATPPPQSQMPTVIEPGALAILARSEIDAQIAEAGTRPRSLDKFRGTVKAIALLNDEAAAECFYSLPARTKSDGTEGEPIEGPSIRFAEIMQYAWTNCRIGARVLEEGSSHITAQGIFSDVETNIVTTFEVRRRIVDKRGRRYSLDMINTTANAACAIARRNAILQAIPRPLWLDLYQEARELAAAGDQAQIARKRDKALAAFATMNISEARVLALLGIETREQIGPQQILKLRGLFSAIRDGETSIAEAFPIKERDDGRKVESEIDKFAGENHPPVASASESASSVAKSTGESADEVAPGGAGGAPKPPTGTATLSWAEAIDKILTLATDKDLDEQECAEILDGLMPAYEEHLPKGHVAELMLTGSKVRRGELKPATARKHLEGLE